MLVDGEDGEDGEDSEDGEDGVDAALINGSGETVKR
jgi:hypothetical protein